MGSMTPAGEYQQQVVKGIQAFLPDQVFDIHAHIYQKSDLLPSVFGFMAEGLAEDLPSWQKGLGEMIGEKRLCGGLFFPYPVVQPGDIPKVNDYLFSQIKGRPMMKGLSLLSPESKPADIFYLQNNPQFTGFKPYHTFSSTKPTFASKTSDFIPEWAWKSADERGLLIMLHLVRDAALSDSSNLQEITEHCRKYPNARLVLAHAGRGFHASNTVKSIALLRGLENVWFDTSAICEADALTAILYEFGPRRLLWGSDFPISSMLGKCVTVGDNFVWLDPETINWDGLSPQCHPLPIGLESLLALKKAADDFGLNSDDMKDIFADNALRLLGIKTETGTLTQDLYIHAKQRIPGGTQLLSKRPEMFAPDQWPAYFREARGCETWDLDGRHYYDMSTNGIGSCLLGFRHPDVTRAVQRRIKLGSMSTLNPPEEVELADLLCELHPWAEQARFARCGGEICAMAVRIARAKTDRSVVAICGYHGWQDWYLAANLGDNDSLRGHLLPGLSPLGVPRELRGSTVSFSYNSREEFLAILDQYGNRLAAVIMEPYRAQDPTPGFMEFVRDGARRCGALLIYDEITIGWRRCCGGAHLKLDVKPDLAVFAKSLGNGHPIAAVIGSRAAMAGAHESFISSTYWTESVGPSAAVATIRVMQNNDIPAHIEKVGMQVQEFWRSCGAQYGLPVHVGGYPCLSHFRFDHEQADALRTLYTQLMLKKGFLAGTGFYPTLAHTQEIVTHYGETIAAVFKEIAAAIETGDIDTRLHGPVAHSGFRRLT